MKNLSRVFFLIIGLLEYLEASPMLSEGKSLAQIQTKVLLSNDKLKSAYHAWKAALKEIIIVGSLEDPKFSYTHYIQEIETRVGPQQSAVAISQKLPWFGKLRLRSEIASKAAKVKELQFMNLKNKLIFSTCQAYYRLYLTTHTLKITRKHLGYLKSIENHLQTQLKLARITLADLLKVQTELERLRDKERSHRLKLIPLKEKLNALMGGADSRDISLPSSLSESSVSSDFSILWEQLQTNNLELKRIDHELSKSQSESRLSKKKNWPDFNISMKQVLTGEAITPGLADSGKDALMLTLGMNIPLWRNKIRSRISAKVEKERQVRLERDSKLKYLRSDLKLAYYEFMDSKEKSLLFKSKLIPKARQTLQLVRNSFESGKKGFTEIMNAESKLLGFELEALQATVDQAMAAAKIKLLLGGQTDNEQSDRDE